MSDRFRVMVVDDEPLARQLIRLLLERDPEVECVGEGSGVEAADRIAQLGPDILFLDIRMPDLDGFDLLERIGAERAPVVVFVTAYAEHAVRAFEVHALDYLLKPVQDDRFARALAHAKAQARARRQGAIDERLVALLRERSRVARRFLVKSRDRTLVVDADEIDWIEAADYYVSIHARGQTHLLRMTLNEMEQQLDPERFFRAHRSAIVNVERVREIRPLFRGDCSLLLSDGSSVRLSRTRRAEFDRLFAPPAGRA